MKVALVGDLHFGVHGDDKVFQNSQFEFMHQLVGDCLWRDIRDIFILGDLFDSRHSINVLTMNRVLAFFFQNESNDVRFHILVGNHDLYYKNSMTVTSLNVLHDISNVILYGSPKKVGIAADALETGEYMLKYNTLVVPWVTDYSEFRERVMGKYPETERIFGHFDIIGAKMDNFNVSESGFKKEDLLEHWKYVYSGHYHHHSETIVGDKKIVYIGSPYQLSRAEIEPKGYYILDTDDESLEFVKNVSCIEYKKLKYPDFPENPEEFITGNIIDVDISWEDSKYMNKVNEYLERIESFQPAYPVNPIYGHKREEASKLDIDASKISILSLGKKYIDNSEDISQKSKVFEELKKLYSKHFAP